MPADTAAAGYPGSITVRQRALNTVARAVSAEALGVPAGQVTVTLQDDHGLLGVSVVAPIRVPDLDTVAPGAPGRTVLHRVQEAQATIRATTTRITGNQVGRVDVRVRGAHISQDERVR
ncbi:hypothetical protein BJQ94_13500 [Cryobacterium sp. SO2]|uniref:hypothetical protein n=1 Tax=Cryobacterium sp. SO2 TaxID=1897060 RepID=UPI00223D7EFE|nr:hypothetical protein [Cryobacterium sp. SO2]WEO76374.1 hypothetical protein BJQ94_13500 [Cryobacterium sp. SO2]